MDLLDLRVPAAFTGIGVVRDAEWSGVQLAVVRIYAFSPAEAEALLWRYLMRAFVYVTEQELDAWSEVEPPPLIVEEMGIFTDEDLAEIPVYGQPGPLAVVSAAARRREGAPST